MKVLRNLLSLLLFVVVIPSANAWTHGIASVFDGGLSQVNFNFINGGGEFPFINKMKESSNWTWADNTSVDAITPDLLDSDGYPIASTKFTTHGGMGTGFPIPTQSEFSGNYQLSWSGSGTLKVAVSAGSGSLTSVSGGGTVTPSGNGFTVTASPWVFTPSSGATALGLSIISVGTPEVTNVAVMNVSEQTAYNNGQIFSTKFLSRLTQAKFGVLRFLNWQEGNFLNATNWDTGNRPTTYFTYNLSQYRTDLLANAAGSGLTTNSGADYSVSAPSTWSTSGGLPADKSIVHVVWNATSPTSATVTFAGGGSPNITWTAHGLVSGNQVYFTDADPASANGASVSGSVLTVAGSSISGTWRVGQHISGTNVAAGTIITSLGTGSGGAGTYNLNQSSTTGTETITASSLPIELTTSVLGTFPSTYYFVTVVDANTINVSATSGGASINFSNAGASGFVVGRTNITLNVGGTAPVQVLNQSASQITASGGGFPVGGSFNSLQTLVYDAFLNAWIESSPGTAVGLHNGVPFSVMLALCTKVGAHPWFVSPPYALTPMSDWTTQLATYLKANAPSWMIPRIEGPNETWNTPAQTGYAQTISQAYGWGTDVGNWYGKAISTIGQAVNAVYGGAVDGTKYQVVSATQDSTDLTPSNNDPRLKSTKYVNNTGGFQTPQAGYTATPAYDWVTTVAHASYENPWQYGYNQEVPLAYAYYVTNSGNPTAQAANTAAYTAGFTGGGTATVSGSTVTMANHGFAANQLVFPYAVFGSTLPTPLSNGENLYVLPTGLTTNSFEVATSEGGTPLSFSGGSGTIYFSPAPQTAPNILTQNILDLNQAMWAANIAAGSKVIYSTRYEGGYLTAYLTGSVTSQVTAATNANPMVLTIGTTSNQGEHTAQPSDQISPVVAGMYFKISGITDPNWTSLNNQVVQVASVSGASITTTFNASAFAAPFAGSGGNGTATYFLDSGATQNMNLALNALRLGGKYSPLMQTYLTSDYTNLASISVVGVNTTVTGQFPSLFQLGGPINATLNGIPVPTNVGNNSWSVLEDVYESPDPPQWNAIVNFN